MVIAFPSIKYLRPLHLRECGITGTVLSYRRVGITTVISLDRCTVPSILKVSY